MPSQIFLLRHAEKPHNDDDPGLSLRGRLRAAAVAIYLPESFGRIDHLFASWTRRRAVARARLSRP